jgi:hypothetical protein
MSNYPKKKLDRVRQNSNKVRQKLDRNLKIIGWNVRKSNGCSSFDSNNIKDQY